MDSDRMYNLAEEFENFSTMNVKEIQIMENGHLVTADTDNTLSIWDVNESRLKQMKTIRHFMPQEAYNLLKIKKISNNRLVYVIKGCLYVVELKEKKIFIKTKKMCRKNMIKNTSKRFSYQHSKKINLGHDFYSKVKIIKYSENLGIVLVMEESNSVEIWDLKSESKISNIELQIGLVHSVCIFSDTEIITGTNLDHTAIWDLSCLDQPVVKYDAQDIFYLDTVNKIKIIRDLNRILTLNSRNKAKVYDFKLSLLFTIADSLSPLGYLPLMKSFCILPNNRLAKANNSDFSVQIYSLINGQLIGNLSKHEAHVNLIKNNDEEILTCSYESKMVKWYSRSLKVKGTIILRDPFTYIKIV